MLVQIFHGIAVIISTGSIESINKCCKLVQNHDFIDILHKQKLLESDIVFRTRIVLITDICNADTETGR